MRKPKPLPPGLYFSDAIADFWVVIDRNRAAWLIDTRRGAWRSRTPYQGTHKNLRRADREHAPLVAKVAGIPPEELGLPA